MSFRLIALRGTGLWNGPARPDLVGRLPALGLGERSAPGQTARTRGSVHLAAIVPRANVPIANRSLMPATAAPSIPARALRAASGHAHDASAEVPRQEARATAAWDHIEQSPHGQAMDTLTWYLRRALKAEQSARLG